MQITENPWRGQGVPEDVLSGAPFPSIDAAAAETLVTSHLVPGQTPLRRLDEVDCEAWVKDERGRMGLGSFKALGAAYVIAHEASSLGSVDRRTYVTASAGNHGLSLAFGATRFGAKSVVYIAETVPESFAERLRDQGAHVVREGATYEDSMSAAAIAAEKNSWTLLSDSSWPGYFELPHRLMEGYLVMAAEAARQMPAPPTHIFLQAGVGGLAGACAAWFRHVWGDAPRIIVVEPEAAPALEASIRAGRPVVTEGPVSHMGRLDCKEPSLIALKGLARDADAFALISEDEAANALPELALQDLASTSSGAAGIAALIGIALSSDARALTILSEATDT